MILDVKTLDGAIQVQHIRKIVFSDNGKLVLHLYDETLKVLHSQDFVGDIQVTND